jgi:hypothetical protein
MTPEQVAERDVYLELNRNESRLIVERLRAMLTFHGLLFTAVGVAAGQRLFLLALLLAFVGALLCLPWYRSVRLSYRGCAAVGDKYGACKPADAPGLDAYQVAPGWDVWLLPEVFLSVAVALTWVVVFIVITYYSCLPPSPLAKS